MTDVSENVVVPEHNILKVVGDLSIFEVGKFHEELVLLNQQEGPLEVDLSQVDRIDSSAVQVIVAATRSGRIRLTGYSQELQERFEQIGFAQFLPLRS
ncbi:MAG: STAS domain-containing protein [Nitrospira sp.]|nr:STAS domain-containing protein [Nitrospira sp.]MCB9711408.1 STAS domain-containing protein [Nitrospiraceae bacterium]MDR4486277.1 STAS domain-containing protein [Nitrospirales bacterium]MCA9467665.1 STAS domain-containing protein [Nitrospira sp.]MCA9480673.1 STAS domain-containing protein [Nitrospira sp.]